MIHIHNRRELFVDHTLIAQMDNVSPKLHEPIPAGYALEECPYIISDEITHVVIWKQGANENQLATANPIEIQNERRRLLQLQI